MVRWGVMGTARIAKRCVIPAILKAENASLHAVASRDLERAQTLVDAHQQGEAHAGYQALLQDPEIDAVYIPLPNHLHKEWSIRSIEAGKHVLVEKPFAMDAHEAGQMAEAARRHDRLLMEGFMYRFHPRSQRIKQLVGEGALGRIRSIHCAFTFPVKPDPNNLRLFTPEMGGGSLWDVGCYGVSLARWLLEEEPVAVSGQAVYAETGVDLSFVGTLRFPSGALAVVESGFTAALQQTYSVIGEEGAVELPHDAFIPWEREARFTLREADQEAGKSVGIPAADEYQRMVEHFSAAVLGEAELAYPPEESVQGMRTLDALAQSARTGEVVQV